MTDVGSAPSNSEPRYPAIRVAMMPKDTNAHGTIFGGVILSHLDVAGGAEARKYAPNGIFVTVAMNHVVFEAPVFIGDVVSFYTATVRVGRTSVTVRCEVWAERHRAPETRVRVMDAELVFVSVDDDRRPVPIRPAQS